MKKLLFMPLLTIFFLLAAAVTPAFAEEEYNWVKGGKTIDVGSNFASLDLPANLMYLNKEDTVKLQQKIGNAPSSKEIGSIYPEDLNESWFIVVEYDEVGYIKDDDKNNIDADAILTSYKEGTEEQNKDKAPDDQIHVVGWDVKPFYDDATKTLQWSMLAEDAQKNPLINYNMQKLTRKGYVSLLLVSDPARLATDKKTLNELLPKFQLKSGNRYEDFQEGSDKVADYGLTGLVLGGLGLAVAKKVGLLALLLVFLKKAWVLVLIVLGVAFRFIKTKIFKRPAAQAEASPVETPTDKDQTM